MFISQFFVVDTDNKYCEKIRRKGFGKTTTNSMNLHVGTAGENNLREECWDFNLPHTHLQYSD